MTFTFFNVSDSQFPSCVPWWVMLIKQGDYESLMQMHEWHSKALFIRDSNDPHTQRACEQDDPIAMLRHPIILGAHWLSTAIKMSERGDFVVNINGGMRDLKGLIEHKRIQASGWPGQIHPERRVTISTWGNHYYLTAEYRPMTFLGKYNTEQEAMDVALLFATPNHIRVERQAVTFKEGD